MPKLCRRLLFGILVLLGGSLAGQSITYSPSGIVAGCPVTFTTSLTDSLFTWDFGPTASTPVQVGVNLQSANVYFQQAGRFWVKLYDTTSCCGSRRDSVLVTVSEDTLPISIIFSPDSACPGTPLTCIAIPSTYLVYSFFIDTSLALQQLPGTFQTNQAMTGDSIAVSAFNGACYTNRVYGYPEIIPTPAAPLLSVNPANDTACAAETITFTASPGYQSYVFSNNSSTQQQGPSNIWETDALNPGNHVSVIGVMDGCYSMISNILPVIILQTPIASLEISPMSSCQDTVVTATAISFGGETYSFYIDSILVQSGSQATYTTDSLKNNDVIWLIAESNGCPSPLVAETFTIENCTGILPVDLASLQLFPNPVNDRLTVVCNDFASNNTEPFLTDVAGQVIHAVYVQKGNQFVFNTAAILPGFYFVQINETGKTIVQKFVKE